MSIQIWKGNRLPALTATITSQGNAVDLTGATVLIYMRPTNYGYKVINGSTVTVTSAVNGQVSYPWAPDDVDTAGDYTAWFTYNILGKTQDTPEFGVTISEHTPSELVAVRPVASDGSTSIYRGDSYLAANNRALVYDLTTYDGPDLTTAGTINFRVEGEFHVTGTALDADTVSFDLTSSQTNIPAATYRFQVEAVLATGSTATLFRNNLTVVDYIVSP